MTPMLRRLNDPERYWGLTWAAWCAAAAAGGVLYGAVRLSPFGLKPTVTFVVLLPAFGVTLVLGVSGQVLSPGRHLRAIVAYQRSPKRWALSTTYDGRGLVLASAPTLIIPGPDVDGSESSELVATAGLLDGAVRRPEAL